MNDLINVVFYTKQIFLSSYFLLKAPTAFCFTNLFSADETANVVVDESEVTIES